MAASLRLQKTIRNSTYHSRIIVLPVLDISPNKIKRLKEIYSDTFHKPIHINEAKALATEFSIAVSVKFNELSRYLERIEVFPFLAQLKPVVDLLGKLQNKSYDWYYANLDEFEHELLDMFEHTVDPILGFLSGSQKSIYEEARKFLIDQQYNLSYIDGDETEKLRDILSDVNCFRGNLMTTAKEYVGILTDRITRRLDESKLEKEKQLASYRKKLENIESYENLSQDHLEELDRRLDSVLNQMQSTTQISMLNDQFRNFEMHEYPLLAEKIQKWGGEVKEDPPGYSLPANPTNPRPVVSKPTSPKPPVTIASVRPGYHKTFLNDQEDVEEYVKAFKTALLAELEKGNSLLV